MSIGFGCNASAIARSGLSSGNRRPITPTTSFMFTWKIRSFGKTIGITHESSANGSEIGWKGLKSSRGKSALGGNRTLSVETAMPDLALTGDFGRFTDSQAQQGAYWLNSNNRSPRAGIHSMWVSWGSRGTSIIAAGCGKRRYHIESGSR